MGFPGGSVVKSPPANAGAAGLIPGKDPLEEEMATHSSILGWKIPWAEEPGALQSMGSQRVEHDRGIEHIPKHAPISMTKIGFFLNRVSLPIPATEQDRHLYGGKIRTISHILLP